MPNPTGKGGFQKGNMIQKGVAANPFGIGGPKKGEVRNPKGIKYTSQEKTPAEPKSPDDVRALARKHTLPAFKVILKVMMDKGVHPATRLVAADMIHKRGWGNPVQPVANPDLTPINFAEMSDDAIAANAARLDSLLSKVDPGLLAKVSQGTKAVN